MSEPARQIPASDTAHRFAASQAPLRDWLATIRTGMEAKVETKADAAAEANADAPVPRVEAAPAPQPNWAPRLVTASEVSGEEDADVAEMMAENLVLKVKLRLEAERTDELQALLAQEIRELRAHVQEEMTKFAEIRAERDLWMARCEALAQPLFQSVLKR